MLGGGAPLEFYEERALQRSQARAEAYRSPIIKAVQRVEAEMKKHYEEVVIPQQVHKATLQGLAAGKAMILEELADNPIRHVMTYIRNPPFANRYRALFYPIDEDGQDPNGETENFLFSEGE